MNIIIICDLIKTFMRQTFYLAEFITDSTENNDTYACLLFLTFLFNDEIQHFIACNAGKCKYFCGRTKTIYNIILSYAKNWQVSRWVKNEGDPFLETETLKNRSRRIVMVDNRNSIGSRYWR